MQCKYTRADFIGNFFLFERELGFISKTQITYFRKNDSPNLAKGIFRKQNKIKIFNNFAFYWWWSNPCCPCASADDVKVTLYVCTVLVLCKTFYRGSHLQLSGTRPSVSQSTVIRQPFSSQLSSRMFRLTDALLISQNFSLVSGHTTEETFNTWEALKLC